jgi:hypothetical protein
MNPLLVCQSGSWTKGGGAVSGSFAGLGGEFNSGEGHYMCQAKAPPIYCVQASNPTVWQHTSPYNTSPGNTLGCPTGWSKTLAFYTNASNGAGGGWVKNVSCIKN